MPAREVLRSRGETNLSWSVSLMMLKVKAEVRQVPAISARGVAMVSSLAEKAIFEFLG